MPSSSAPTAPPVRADTNGDRLPPIDEDATTSAYLWLASHGAYLDPNGAGLPRWSPFGPTQSDLVMELGDKVGMRPHPDNAGIVFLEKHPSQTSR